MRKDRCPLDTGEQLAERLAVGTMNNLVFRAAAQLALGQAGFEEIFWRPATDLVAMDQR